MLMIVSAVAMALIPKNNDSLMVLDIAAPLRR
jgi:hypothetical protein